MDSGSPPLLPMGSSGPSRPKGLESLALLEHDVTCAQHTLLVPKSSLVHPWMHWISQKVWHLAATCGTLCNSLSAVLRWLDGCFTDPQTSKVTSDVFHTDDKYWGCGQIPSQFLFALCGARLTQPLCDLQAHCFGRVLLIISVVLSFKVTDNDFCSGQYV